MASNVSGASSFVEETIIGPDGKQMKIIRDKLHGAIAGEMKKRRRTTRKRKKTVHLPTILSTDSDIISPEQ